MLIANRITSNNNKQFKTPTYSICDKDFNYLTCKPLDLFDVSHIGNFVQGWYTCEEMRDSDIDVGDNEANALTFSFRETLARMTEA